METETSQVAFGIVDIKASEIAEMYESLHKPLAVAAELERIAVSAAQRAAYLDARSRGGTHETASKAFNWAGHIVYTKALGYRDYTNIAL